ncbi:sugar porter family MFS transporter [Asticcacaulis sp. 201]|uniref:sugar porter family MFS transporter n=1 Tax=Asticcacaulis sp. 201 TaxID=3028787 RepID=UPI002916C78D|nr:sugar porter family MFS transporter [Asticcacaulis sp. 201]MDV6330672.1 sugar porter family MFS transporter [Asticcacaulis sp. 201]
MAGGSQSSEFGGRHGPGLDEINGPFVLLLSAIGALGGLMFGFDIAIITGAGPFIEQQFHLNPVELGVAFSSLLFGCVIGSALAGFLADIFGRRAVMIAVALVFAATSVATGMADTFLNFNIARFLGGIAVGAVSLVAPMYVAEVAPASLRGRMGALYQTAIVIGILVSYFINYALRNGGPDAWRHMFYTGAIPAAIYLVLMLMAPETPRYLVRKGKSDKARNILVRTIGERAAIAETQEIEASLQEGQPRLADILKPSVRIPIIIGFCLAILIHFSGVNTVIDYAPIIFKSAGFNIDAALLSTFVVGIANLVFTLISFWVIDRLGRRPLYIFGSIGMGLTLVALVVAVLTGHFTGMVVLILVVAYLMFFASCIGPVFWTLVPEIFPNQVRSSAMIVPVLVQWFANGVVVFIFPSLFAGLGQAITFGLLAAACLLQALFAFLFVPETKGRSLEEIAQQWGRKEG